MSKPVFTVLFLATCLSAVAQTPPLTEGQLSSTRLLSVERVKATGPDQGPDGLSFCFLVSRTPAAQHKFAIKETKDFTVSQQSYRELSQSALGRTFEPKTAVHDATRYAAEHPEVASAVAVAPPRSLIITSAISGPKLKEGDAIQIILHLGFGRSADKPPESENLIFTTTVPAM
jgi:hypothetical protein